MARREKLILAGLRHLVLDHQLPHRGDAEAQAGRLHHSIHGGSRQGDFGDEALRKHTCHVTMH
jgi:hypothetical protein